MNKDSIERRILAALGRETLSTSMLARKAKLSRITATKYLSSLQSKGKVLAAHVGRAHAWRSLLHKPTVAVIAKTETARMAQLALSDEFAIMLATAPSQIPHAFCVLTDQPRIARVAETEVILVGHLDENAYCIPEYFELTELLSLVRKVHAEDYTPELPHAAASITLENIDSIEELFGFSGAEELISTTKKLLAEHGLPFTQVERVHFIIDGPIPEAVLADLEREFPLVLAHVYGETVVPGDELTFDGIEHTVPCLTMTLAAPARTETPAAEGTKPEHQ